MIVENKLISFISHNNSQYNLINEYNKLIEKLKYDINKIKEDIQKDREKLFDVLGCIKGEKVKLVLHEWIGPLNAYQAPNEFILEIDSFWFYNDKNEIHCYLKKPKRKRLYNTYNMSSFSLFKLNGELIIENKKENTEERYYDEETKNRIKEYQKI